MAEGGGGGGDRERISISEAVKSHKKYGSIMNNTKKHEPLIKHVVSPEETLQGIALRYGVTMEQIRRANKIWANESLFLRETLLIPAPNSNNEVYSVTTSPNDEADKSSSTSDISLVAGSERLTETSESDKSNQTIADILIRIDNSIARTRTQVEKREKLHDQRLADDCLPRVKQRQSRMRQLLQSPTSPENSTGGDPLRRVTVQPVAMAQGKKVKSSLQRLQKEQDEMFEL